MFRSFFRILHFFMRGLIYEPFLNKCFNFYFRNKVNYIFHTERITKKKDMHNLANKFGTDKGGDSSSNINKRKQGLSNYTPLYERLFSRDRLEYKLIFEVGIGSNNIDVPSNMGKNGFPGASLFMWQEYFPNAEIYGADIDKRILFNQDRIKTFHVDQYSNESIQKMWKDIKKDNFDVIIDDGIHSFDGNINFFENSINFLKRGGLYIIEDINNIYVKEFRDYFVNSDYEVDIIDYHPSKSSNFSSRILIIYK